MCPTPPMMVRYFNFDGEKSPALKETKQILESLGYSVDVFAPESNFLVTKATQLKRDIRRYDYSLAVYITDMIQIHIIAEKYVFKRSSESSLGGGEDITEKQISDRLPYEIQQKVFGPIIKALDAKGFKEDTEKFKETWVLHKTVKKSIWRHDLSIANSRLDLKPLIIS
jgi:hypothetical protein